MIRLDRGRHPLLCPIRALERLIQAAGDGPIFPPGRLAASTVRGFDPMTNELPHRLIQEIRDHALVLTTYWGALRPEEVGRLQISDLGRTDRTYQLTLRQTKSARNGEVHQVTLHPRTGPLDPCQALDDWIELRGTRPGPLFGAVQPTRPKTSRPGLTSDRIKRIIARRAAAAGVGVPVSGHSLRRSWATHRWLEGVPIKAISAHLRHSETKTTIRYIHNIEGMSPDTGRLLLDEALIYWVGEGRTSFESPAGFSQTPIQTLTVQAAQLRETRAFTPDTSRVYSYHWKRWCRFASASGFEMLPASDEEVGLYLGQLALDGSRPSTLSSHLNAILAAHRQLDREPDHNFAFSKRVIEGHRRRSDPSATPAALTPEQVLAIARSAADQDVETLALVAVCYAGALTTGALTRLYVEDLAESGGHGVSATIAASGRKPTRSVFLPQRQDILDPVNALRSLLGKRTTGPVFERHPGAGYAMSAQAMRERIARAAADAQVTQRVTPTALRKSWAAHARLRGVDPVTIQRHLHHSSPVTTDEFVRLMPTWTENPALTIIEELKLNLPDDRSSL